MTRRSPAAQQGHNSRTPLTDEEQEALGVHHQLAITEAQRKLDVALAEVSGLRKLVNGQFKKMTADLHYTRKDFQAEVLDKLAMSETEYKAHVAKVDRLHRIAGLKQGEQLDLLDHAMDTVDESEAAFQDGYRAGRRADDPFPPEYVAPILHPKWLEGWHAGQAFNGMRLTMAAEILARPKPGEMAEGEDPDESDGDEDDDDLDPDSIQAQSRALAKSSWMEPTADEQQFEGEAA